MLKAGYYENKIIMIENNRLSLNTIQVCCLSIFLIKLSENFLFIKIKIKKIIK